VTLNINKQLAAIPTACANNRAQMRSNAESWFASATANNLEAAQRGTPMGAVVDGGYRSDRGDWPSVQQPLVNAMLRLERALKPHLNKLKQG
jgi:hypothetical protein